MWPKEQIAVGGEIPPPSVAARLLTRFVWPEPTGLVLTSTGSAGSGKRQAAARQYVS